MVLRVGIINVTGYAGVELARLLACHHEVELVSVTARSDVGRKLGDVFPHLASLPLRLSPEIDRSVDLVFSALPHKASAEAVAPLLQDGIRVVDISADFRLKDPQVYQRWYEVVHPAPEWLAQAVYGLTELHRREVSLAQLVANPGCFPTGAILALAPALVACLIAPDVVVDSKSGVSGAGRALSLTTHFAEVNENTQAYGLEGHRHLPEIEQELALLRPGVALAITFVPHLIPMTRGILTTCYAPLVTDRPMSEEEIRELYREYYAREPFVRVADAPPQTKHTLGNNFCLVYPVVDPRTRRLVVISALDNLVKGAAGQAIQNMNVMAGFPETMGLEGLALYP